MSHPSGPAHVSESIADLFAQVASDVPLSRNDRRRLPSKTRVVNLTGEDIHIRTEEGELRLTIPDANAGRPMYEENKMFTNNLGIDGVTVDVKNVDLLSSAHGLPSIPNGPYYIVSPQTARAVVESGRATWDLVLAVDPTYDENGARNGYQNLAFL